MPTQQEIQQMIRMRQMQQAQQQQQSQPTPIQRPRMRNDLEGMWQMTDGRGFISNPIPFDEKSPFDSKNEPFINVQNPMNKRKFRM